jgi:general secretion pathway protein B
MSYILDALRKSDQQRRIGQVPTLTFAPQAPLAPEPRAKASYGSLGVIVIITIGMVLAWLRPLSTAPTPAAATAERSVEMPPRQPAPALLQVAPEPVVAKSLHSVVPAVVPPVPAKEANAPVPASGGKRHLQAKAATADRPSIPAMGSTPPDNVPDTRGAQLAPVVGSADLPQSIRKALPVMTVAVHAYSDRAADRLVSINGRLLHEGDALAPGLRLDQITPDGMVFSYRGYRFRRGSQ